MKLGVIEGFFGPEWPMQDRLGYADFLSRLGGSFYIYAPKRDQLLRKGWREVWPADYLATLRQMAEAFHRKGIAFGVGLSPFGLGENFSAEDESHIQQKIELLEKVGIDLLGVFFDDMPSTPNLAKVQIKAIDLISRHFKKKIVFCPSYYCFDPILDKVFGQRPDHYLEDIAEGMQSDIAFAWTGPKVISPTIDSQHLSEVNQLLKRKPFMWENLFANDGPKNCKFLKLRPFDGRDGSLHSYTEAWGFNMMNQPYLSQITYLASSLVLIDGLTPDDAFSTSLKTLCSKGFATFIEQHRQDFLTKGLDVLTAEIKNDLVRELQTYPDPAAKEIIGWLLGHYLVGPECLTD